MNELLKRLKAYPLVTAELLGASFFANILALASSLFVVQVLNRYVAHGVTASLVTLVVGMLIAILFEVLFRQLRLTLADALSRPFDRALAERVYDVLTYARADALGQLSTGQKREVVAATDAIQQTYSAPNIAAYLDLPFALVFLTALLLLSPTLAGIAVLFMFIVVGMGSVSLKAMRAPAVRMQTHFAERQGLLDSALIDPDTVRAFTAQDYLKRRWVLVQNALEGARAQITGRQGGQQNLTVGIQALLSTAVIATGGMLVVNGHLDVGLLIGANILASRALGPVIRISQLAGPIVKATHAAQVVENFTRLPLEDRSGSALGSYKGGLEFKDVAFAYSGQSTPLFESLTLKLEPSAVLVVSGSNGAGKTTLARLIVGLIRPSRGQILVDGVDLSQVAPEWWRRQIVYVPQEPGFFSGTVRENITAFNPQLDQGGLNAVIRDAGLEKFFAASQHGFDMKLQAGAHDLPVGIRRRLGLARALAMGGKLVVMDEPTEGLDSEGTQRIGSVLNELSKRGCTIIALSHDPNIIKGASNILDLNSKPIPRILRVPSDAPQALAEGGDA